MNEHVRPSRLKRAAALPASLPPRGLDREQAAAYLGVSPSKFDQMRDDGRVSPGKRIDGRIVWDRHRLDKDWERLPDEAAPELVPSQCFD